jgi:hypothetical protein
MSKDQKRSREFGWTGAIAVWNARQANRPRIKEGFEEEVQEE